MFDLDYQHDGAVALLTLKRPPANAFTPDGLLKLQTTIERLNGERAWNGDPLLNMETAAAGSEGRSGGFVRRIV